ncbi:hypothetical protein CI109_107384 [Kwoniella shandongensis]|uniref:Uncharacterized protein n=1 Tax=Kwoniella shandongensis TaxID=1734106 RepID=A0A5M6BYE4_9TREE|nr:uncharacterized protein CI109_004688 [Kwoniella shandongensis]KAA5526912.1 hypothetical protein CI109_004688 [Kwoniella shandongensis]
MPTVLLTGITGFLSAHVALIFLQNGWTVRGTLRSNSKRAAVLAIPEYAPFVAEGKLELVVTGALENSDYSTAIQGVDAVVHTASPVEFGDEDFRETHLAPALKGTTGVFEAVEKENGVKAVVYTSTYGAIGYHREHPTQQVGKVLTEEDWNPYTLEELDEIAEQKSAGDNPFGPGTLFYMGAKKYAELAAWDAYKAAQAKGAKWSLAVINPAMIWGPPIQPLDSLSNGGMSTSFLWMLAAGKDSPVMPTMYPYYADVREVAQAHYNAVIKQAQGRFILAAGTYDLQEFADMLREEFPEQKDRFALGTPGKYIYKDPGVYTLKNEKSIKELGIQYRPKVETLRDAFTRFFDLEQQGLK